MQAVIMLLAGSNLKIINAVIQAVAVLVMDYLSIMEFAAKVLFHHMAMDKNNLFVKSNTFISPLINPRVTSGKEAFVRITILHQALIMFRAKFLRFDLAPAVRYFTHMPCPRLDTLKPKGVASCTQTKVMLVAKPFTNILNRVVAKFAFHSRSISQIGPLDKENMQQHCLMILGG
jgi:hypothetical protein